MIELTEQQVDALENTKGSPLCLMNPRTKATYVLLPVDEVAQGETEPGEGREGGDRLFARDLIRPEAILVGPPPLVQVSRGPGEAIVADVRGTGHRITRVAEAWEPVFQVIHHRYPRSRPHWIQASVIGPIRPRSEAGTGSSPVRDRSAANQ